MNVGCILHGLAEEARPVPDAVEEVAGVDEVNGGGLVEPVIFGVVDFEDEVGRDPDGGGG